MPDVSLTEEEMAKVSRLSHVLAEDEQLRERISTDPQAVLREFGLDTLAASIRPGSGISVPDLIAVTAHRDQEGHTDWVPHWDHTDSHKDSWGSFRLPNRD
jgi:hypothetical protein